MIIQVTSERPRSRARALTDDVAAATDDLRRQGVILDQDVHDTAWGTRECVFTDDQGHTLYFGQQQ